MQATQPTTSYIEMSEEAFKACLRDVARSAAARTHMRLKLKPGARPIEALEIAEETAQSHFVHILALYSKL